MRRNKLDEGEGRVFQGKGTACAKGLGGPGDGGHKSSSVWLQQRRGELGRSARLRSCRACPASTWWPGEGQGTDLAGLVFWKDQDCCSLENPYSKTEN